MCHYMLVLPLVLGLRLFLAINFRRMLSLYRPAINVSINCSSLSVYSQSLAIMRVLVTNTSVVSFALV